MSAATVFPPGTGVVALADIAHLTGLEVLQAVRDGKFPAPPISAVLDFALTEVEHGRVVFTGRPRVAFYNPLGTVHGGWIGTLLDSCLGCAVHATLAAGEAYTTVEYKVNFVKAVTERTGEVKAEGRVTSRGRRIATSEGRLVDAKGTVLALGTTTCLIFPLSEMMPKPSA
ncbi:MAG: PaaI family thioesterase [Hyphomicrobiaceae bacterium]